jgi:hypothetical protein
MAIKELRLPSTGIYQRTNRSAELRCSTETASDLMRLRSLASNPQADPLPSFDEIEKCVTEFLEQYLRQRGGLSDVDRRDAAAAGIEYVANRHIESGRAELEEKFRQHISQEEKDSRVQPSFESDRANRRYRGRLVMGDARSCRADCGRTSSITRTALEQAQNAFHIDSVEQLPRLECPSIGVVPTLPTYLGPRTAAAALTAST